MSWTPADGRAMSAFWGRAEGKRAGTSERGKSWESIVVVLPRGYGGDGAVGSRRVSRARRPEGASDHSCVTAKDYVARHGSTHPAERRQPLYVRPWETVNRIVEIDDAPQT